MIETRGDRGTDEYEFRFTAYGRLVSQGHEPHLGVADGLSALERLKTGDNTDAVLVSAMVATLLGEIVSLRSENNSPPLNQSADIVVTGRLLEALEECHRYSLGPYLWREKSMSRLVAMGLVETWHPPKLGGKTVAYRLTDSGLKYVAARAVKRN